METKDLIQIHPGDCFFTKNSPLFDLPINVYQRIMSDDHKAEYGHCGTIIDTEGTTFEALWKIKNQNIWEAYKGEKILIGRHCCMTPAKAKKGYDAVRHRLGQRYPWWRIPLMLIPPLARKVNLTGRGVCSETMFKQLNKSGFPEYKWNGRTPDNGADLVKYDPDWEIIFEGIVK